MKVYQNIIELIGNTPIIKLNNYQKELNLNANLYCKLESYNPAGSVKDRIAYVMIKDAEEKGILKPDSVIIEPTSGNTGIGLAAVCAAKGYRAILVMPDTMSIERRTLLKALGATLVLTPGSEGMKGAIAKANEIARETKNAFIPSQFDNPANPEIHKKTTGPEIYRDLDGKVDIFVSGIGTGGTISGAGEYLKSKIPHLKVVGIEPVDSPVITKGVAGSHQIQGIGAGFIPNTLNTNIYDEIIAVENEEAFAASRKVAKLEGLLVGISSGAAIHAGTLLAERSENKDKNIVIILPDSGERYLSTSLYLNN